MSKERLEELAYNVGVSLDGEKSLMSSDDYDFLYNYALEQAERVQELEKEFELYDIIHHKIGMTVNNPNISDDEKWKEVNGLLSEAWESNCIHCNGKGFNGLDYCPNCVRGEVLQENIVLEEQNNRYRDFIKIASDPWEIARKISEESNEKLINAGEIVGWIEREAENILDSESDE